MRNYFLFVFSIWPIQVHSRFELYVDCRVSPLFRALCLHSGLSRSVNKITYSKPICERQPRNKRRKKKKNEKNVQFCLKLITDIRMPNFNAFTAER